jgi:hypothetical protein
LLQPCLRKIHLRMFSTVDGFAVDGQLFFGDPKFFESLRQLQSNRIFVYTAAELDFDFQIAQARLCVPE